ncbi:soluble lytic murein transglycosylase [Palleronia marisminoris]|uniref:Soluble lytic murein transglycosylase n=1 Tax=Palleronia marisminoris TaxID=315423 RepID=A0A1Y5T4J4_9RHOB|nr:lytic transglycosylase domain-containing protein [Palleronia marisminoris]SFH08254.1 soluble lytic murein transglycosylase [Palleronia marisminoris]SLN52161.1 Soluble lytic murein transglycosylase precursor [Palleronia marisminoris]
MRHLLIVTLFAFASPVVAQEAPPDAPGFDVGIAEAIERARAGQWLSAGAAAERAGPVSADIIEWMYLRDGFGDFASALAFLERRPDWPGLARLRAQAEQYLPETPAGPEQAEDVLRFFGDTTPATGRGTVALVNAYRALDRDADAQAETALAWTTRSMTEGAERALLSYYPDMLEPLEEERADRMFWMGESRALTRSADRLDGNAGALVRARSRALGGADPSALAESLPEALRADPGLAYREFRQHIAGGRTSAAERLTLQQSPDNLGDPEAWARARRDMVRDLMREGEDRRAYALAASNGLVEGSDFADLEWLAGYLALTRLDRPEDALAHFQNQNDAVFTPISLGRAWYWIGRAHEALGQAEEAQVAYEEGAKHQTSFYGLLAAEKIGAPVDPALIDAGPSMPLSEASFRTSSVLEAALLLQAAGERDMAEQFFAHLVESLDVEEAATLGDLILELGEPHIAVLVAKRAAQNGIVIPRAYYPVVDLGQESMPVSEALALSIARRESEFDPSVSSHVGAGGLMQLMPGTAQDVTRSLGIGYSRDRLFEDPSYNARLGTAYLAGLERRFGQNPVLVSSGYNAGPGRPLQWMKARGDPREADVDVIDWIEMIPFDETRNYAMRVAESLPVYRARLGNPDERITLTEELKGR